MIDPTERAPARNQHAVYQVFDALNVLIYVGETSDVARRLNDHARDSAWWPVRQAIHIDYVATRSEAKRREASIIQAARPRFNRASNPDWTGDPSADEINAALDDYIAASCPDAVSRQDAADRLSVCVDVLLIRAAAMVLDERATRTTAPG